MNMLIKEIRSDIEDYINTNLRQSKNYHSANKIVQTTCGIESFFANQEELITFLGDFTSGSNIFRESKRREYGDFQTPYDLTEHICSYLSSEKVNPGTLIEPTFGKGSFIISALKHFPALKKVYGIEIHRPYYWLTKIAILDLFINNPHLNKPEIILYHDDVFKFNIGAIKRVVTQSKNILVLGNPPWVTSSELSTLDSKNLPRKSNFKYLNGIDAITGKGNFDIGEYVILLLLNFFSDCSGDMAMLAKNSVIRNLIYDLPRTKYKIADVIQIGINAKEFFNASVEASLFKCKLNSDKPTTTCKTALLASPTIIENEYGWVDGKFVSNVELYRGNKIYDGISPFVWRQGVKHDCSAVMELDKIDANYINGLGQVVDIEEGPIYGLIKSSDLNEYVIKKPRKYIIITQKKVGEETRYLSKPYPNLYKYLHYHIDSFKKRKSGIYKDKPLFSIFGIGTYSFLPYKVAISGLYKRSTFSLLLPCDNKPLMLDDTCYFLSFEKETDAIIVWAILNSDKVQRLLSSIVFLDAKRPYTKDVLMRVDIIKIIENMTYEDINDQIRALDKKLLCNISKLVWEDFCAALSISRSSDKQYTFF